MPALEATPASTWPGPWLPWRRVRRVSYPGRQLTGPFDHELTLYHRRYDRRPARTPIGAPESLTGRCRSGWPSGREGQHPGRPAQALQQVALDAVDVVHGGEAGGM